MRRYLDQTSPSPQNSFTWSRALSRSAIGRHPQSQMTSAGRGLPYGHHAPHGQRDGTRPGGPVRMIDKREVPRPAAEPGELLARGLAALGCFGDCQLPQQTHLKVIRPANRPFERFARQRVVSPTSGQLSLARTKLLEVRLDRFGLGPRGRVPEQQARHATEVLCERLALLPPKGEVEEPQHQLVKVRERRLLVALQEELHIVVV